MKRNAMMLLTCLVLTGAMVAPWSPAAAWEPKDQCECIAPANPGGGWDAVAFHVGPPLFPAQFN
mgnify:CR=1 FL=1